MDRDEFGRQVSHVAALADGTRRDLYLYVAAQAAPVSREEAASALSLARHTVKFHLDRLVEQGLLDVDYRRVSGRQGPGAGRPAKLYRRATGETSVTLPQRTYDIAGALMAQAIELAQRDGVAALDALDSVARDHGARLGALARERAATTGETASERAASAGTASTDSVLDVLAEGGYEPRACEAAITLVNCPFHRLAQDHTALVCRMNLSLICGLVEAAGAGLSAALEPGEHRCCVVLKAT